MPEYEMTMSPGFLARLMADDMERRTADDGVRALIKQYYEDYTDATELEGKFLASLEFVTGGGAYLSTSVDDCVVETEQELRDSGREVRTPGYGDEDDDE